MVMQALGLGNLKRVNIVGSKKEVMPPGFRQTLRNADFMDTTTPTDITTVSGSYVRLGAGFTVPAQTAYRWGFGDADHPDNQGYIYLSLVDDTAGDATQEDGTIRMNISDNRGLRRETKLEMETEQLDGSQVDRRIQIPLPEQGPLARFNDILFLEFRARAVDIIQPDFCVLRLPVTLYQPMPI